MRSVNRMVVRVGALLAWGLLTGGCSSASAPPPSPPRVAAADELIEPVAPLPSGDPLLGEGALALYADGTLVAGPARTRVALVEEDAIADQGVLRRTAFDSEREAIVLGLPTSESEDPPNRLQVFFLEGDELHLVLDVTPGGYGPRPLRLPGDGTARLLEGGWEACDRAGHPTEPVPRQEVVFRLAEGGVLTESERIDTDQRQLCDELAACPYVDVIRDQGAVRVGEILRHLRGASSYAENSLLLPPAATGDEPTLRVRLSEEKSEVTLLDALWLEVDGQVIPPAGCAGGGAYCEVDRRFHRLRPGDTLEVRFAMPPDAVGARRLVAVGYYEPLASGDSSSTAVSSNASLSSPER